MLPARRMLLILRRSRRSGMGAKVWRDVVDQCDECRNCVRVAVVVVAKATRGPTEVGYHREALGIRGA